MKNKDEDLIFLKGAFQRMDNFDSDRYKVLIIRI